MGKELKEHRGVGWFEALEHRSQGFHARIDRMDQRMEKRLSALERRVFRVECPENGGDPMPRSICDFCQNQMRLLAESVDWCHECGGVRVWFLGPNGSRDSSFQAPRRTEAAVTPKQKRKKAAAPTVAAEPVK